MLMFLFKYLITGLVLVVITGLAHASMAVKLGYDPIKCRKVLTTLVSDNVTIKSFIIGLLIWPVRLYNFIRNQKEIFNMYK